MSATSNGVPPDGMCVFSSDTMANVRLMVIFGVDDVEDVAQRQYAVVSFHGGELNRRVASAAPISKLTTCWPRPAITRSPGLVRIRTADLVPIRPRDEDRALLAHQRGETILQRSDAGPRCRRRRRRAPRPWRSRIAGSVAYRVTA